MNPNTRHNCLEVPLSDTERASITTFCNQIGIARSVFARLSMAHFIDQDDMPRICKAESLPRRGVPVASRASAGRASSRGHSGVKCPGKGGAGGSHRVLQV